MKKMMFLAVMMSALLMPAQMTANNRDNARPRVENRGDSRKGPKGTMRPGKPKDKKFDKKDKGRRPMPPTAKRGRRPMPRPKPVPPPPPRHHHHHHHCDNGAIKAAATIIGVAAIVSAIAD